MRNKFNFLKSAKAFFFSISTNKLRLFLRRRVRVDDVRPARVRACASSRDACVRARASCRLQQARVDDSGRRANARARVSLLRAYVRVRVRVPSLSLLLY